MIDEQQKVLCVDDSSGRTLLRLPLSALRNKGYKLPLSWRLAVGSSIRIEERIKKIEEKDANSDTRTDKEK